MLFMYIVYTVSFIHWSWQLYLVSFNWTNNTLSWSIQGFNEMLLNCLLKMQWRQLSVVQVLLSFLWFPFILNTAEAKNSGEVANSISIKQSAAQVSVSLYIQWYRSVSLYLMNIHAHPVSWFGAKEEEKKKVEMQTLFPVREWGDVLTPQHMDQKNNASLSICYGGSGVLVKCL